MSTQNSSNKIFIIVIALLLVANIATLAMLLGKKAPDAVEEHKGYMRSYLKKEIGFSDKQLQDFDTVKSVHRAQVKIIFDQIRNRRIDNLKTVGLSAFTDSSLTVAAAAAAAEQENLEMNLLHHLRDVRNLCTPAQRAVFDTGFYKVMAKAAQDKAAQDAKKKEN